MATSLDLLLEAHEEVSVLLQEQGFGVSGILDDRDIDKFPPVKPLLSSIDAASNQTDDYSQQLVSVINLKKI